MNPTRKTVILKKKGRPATGQDPISSIRLPADLTQAIDKWAEGNRAGSRSEAMRRLIELGLTVNRKGKSAAPAGARTSRKDSRKAASKAREMAGRELDRLGDQSVPDEEREKRKRRLTKGPNEFRDMRGDLPKSKG
jgi:hypothetical protein